MSNKLKYICLLIVLTSVNVSAHDTLKVLFVYGSKPLVKGESRSFGGIHGGHVSLKYKTAFASFVHEGKLHLFPKKKALHSKFIVEKDRDFREDTSISRYVIISIPINDMQSKILDSILTQRLKNPSYDYAFLGFRCASSAYEVLSSAGIFKHYSYSRIKFKFFYPKRLRKYLLREAKKNQWPLFWRSGIKSRKWEKD